MRIAASAFLVFLVFVLVTGIMNSWHVELEPVMYDYVVQNFEEDTHAKNAVASILLNYRMYDTMFEALILLAAIIGMNQFLPRESDMHHQESPRASAQDREEV
jgi:multisubunit Na+/H+ antiporter MnhB subunit